ncbi:MAG TPA: hypothetical protein VGY31_03380 [Terriglobia bacterium]|nr:hypothetical protein [Terriglobia bacterium]
MEDDEKRQMRIVGVPGPPKEQIERLEALKAALQDLHSILEMQSRGLLPGSVISIARTIKGDELKVSLKRGKNQ